MQTRKRNIDSVLNLVNPKRLKLLNANQKKDNDESAKTSPKKKINSTPKDGNKNKGKQGTVTNKKVNNGLTNSALIHDTARTKCEINNDNRTETNKAGKPFKKRPVVKEKSTVIVSVSKTLKLVNDKPLRDEATHTVDKTKEGNSVSGAVILNKDLQTVQEIKVDKDDSEYVEYVEQYGIADDAKKSKSDDETLDLKKVEVDGNRTRETPEAANNPPGTNNFIVKVEVKSETGELDESNIILEPDSDNNDDEFVDAGAIEDDMDADFVVPKRGDNTDNNNTHCLDNFDTNTGLIDMIDVKNIKVDGTEEESIARNPKYKCAYCHRAFFTKYSLKKHLVRHTGDKPYKCETCGMRFGLNSYLKRHMEVHMDDSEKPFMCSSCPRAFSRKSSLEVHLVSHQDARPFSCQICFKKFKRKMTLQCHIKSHKQGKIYVCQFCGKSFGFRSTLEAHILKHSDVKPYSCEECGKGFYTKQSYHDHMMRHKKIKEVACQICDRRYYNKKELSKHMTFHTNSSSISCEPCQMYFNDEHSKRIHMVKSHKREYPCDFCESIFPSHRSYKTHIFREHRELRNARRSKMPMHEKANFKHVLCDFCGKELSNKYRLKSHLIAKHSGMKRPRAPKDPNKVKVPVKSYPSGMKVLCTICNKIMHNKYKLYTHMEKMHDIPIEEIPKIQLVKLGEGMHLDSETELKQRLGSDIDVQTIVIKPVTTDPNVTEDGVQYEGSTVHVTEDGVQYEGSTVHYLDAHGNIIYTDASNGKGLLNEYMKLEYSSAESNQESEPALIEAGSNGSVSILTKGRSHVDFPKGIVDFAAHAAKIIDIDEESGSTSGVKLTDVNDKQVRGSLNKSVDELAYVTSTNSSNGQDITFIVQQAANQIAAHEEAEVSRSLLNKNDGGSNEDEIQLIVNDVENLEGVIERYNQEGVKYIIEEAGNDNINLSELGYVVKDGQTELESEIVLPENSDTNQQQKIIIIDEQGGEQIIAAGSSDQIKIIYDPETGLYTYITEEVVDQQVQDDGSDPLQEVTDNGNYNLVILNEEDLGNQTVAQTHEATNPIAESLEEGTGADSFNASDNLNEEQENKDNEGPHDKQLDHLENESAKDPFASIHSTISGDQAITIESPGITETSATNQLLPTSQAIESVSNIYSVSTSIDTIPLQLNSSGVTETNLQNDIGEVHSSKEILHQSEQLLCETDTSITVSEYSTMLPPDINTSFNDGQPQNSQLFTSAVDSSSILSSQSTESVASVSDINEYQYVDQDKTSFTQHSHLDTVSTSHEPINEVSSQIFEDINQSVPPLQQTSETLKTDFPNLVYTKSILNLDNDAISSDHTHDNIGAENVIIHTVDNVGQELEAGMSGVGEMDNSNLGNKKDLLQLENILKSGIKEVSNTVEYSSFLDRMIDHLQIAKENVIVPEKEVEAEDINESQS